jgi:uncharacterized SAM-binding protein YcdF (DUF218 family)
VTDLIVIFGARVMPDGRPSRSLRRRIDGGAASARQLPDAPILCSGAAGAPGELSEASVMRRELTAAGIDPGRLILDEASRDTLQSVLVAVRLAAARGFARCIVCSDAYHVPRIRLMLALLGVPSAKGAVEFGLKDAGLGPWLGMVAREAAAIPYDAAIVLVRGKRLLAAS